MPKLTQGSKIWDGGGLILSPKERDELIRKYPQLSDYIKLFVSSENFFNGEIRYCLWLVDAEPSVYSGIDELTRRFEIVKKKGCLHQRPKQENKQIHQHYSQKLDNRIKIIY